MAKTASTHLQTEQSGLKGTFDHLLDRLYPRLDWLFLLRPTIFIPVWVTTAAGLGGGQWLSVPNLFWRVAWDWGICLLFVGVTLITAAAFLRTQLQEGGELDIKGYPSVLKEGNIASGKARRLTWILLGLGLVLVIPGGWLALLTGAALFVIWGLLYGSLPAIWGNRPVVEASIHLLAGAALFYLGWAASGAPLVDSLNLAAPYLLAFAGVSGLTAITPGPQHLAAGARPSNVLITFTLAIATLMAAVATVWGYRNGDPVISTTAVLTLPFFVVALYYRRMRDVVRTNRYLVLIFAIFVGSRYPLLFIPIIIDFYLSRYYYRRRFGFVHPAFHAEHE
ncbi:MAG: hypothetical protein ACETWG_06520 [Candidatus Neomarinimicrobiota bacterium]